MTQSEKAEAYDRIREMFEDVKKTEAFFSAQEGMGPQIETVQAHAFRNLRRKYFAEKTEGG